MRIEGIVVQIHHISVGGGSIFRIQSAEHKRPIKVVANYKVSRMPPTVGGFFSVEGVPENGIYGKQLIALALAPMIPRGRSALDFVTKFPLFAGLIPRKAAHIIKSRGIDLNLLLTEGDPLKLMEYGVLEQHIFKLRLCWKRYCLRCHVYSFLSDQCIPVHLNDCIIKFWGENSISVLKNNPYVLCPFLPWTEVDDIGRNRFNVKENASERLIAAVKWLLGKLIKHGKTTFSLGDIKRLLRRVLLLPTLVEQAISVAIANCEIEVIVIGAETYVRLYGIAKIESNLVKAIKCSPMITPQVSNLRPAASSASSPETRQVVLHSLSAHEVFQTIVETHRCFFICSYWDFISCFRMAGGRGFNVTHVVPSLSYAGMLQGQGLKEVVTYFELLRAVENPPDELHDCITFIHNAHAVDTLTLNKLLLSIPMTSPICLVGQLYQTPISGVGSPFRDFITVPSFGKPEGALSKLAGHGLDICGLNIESIDFDYEYEVRFVFPDLSFFTVDSAEGILMKVLSLYREKADIHDTLICTATQKMASSLNDKLHHEQAELRKFEGHASLFLSLRGKENGTVGDKVVFYGCDYSRGLISGVQGTIKEIFSPVRFSISESGQYISSVGIVAFHTVGDIEITSEDQVKIVLGYAVPLHRLFLSKWQEVILVIENTKMVGRDWISLASSLAEQSTTIVSRKSLFSLMLRQQKCPKVSSAYLYSHHDRISIIDASQLYAKEEEMNDLRHIYEPTATWANFSEKYKSVVFRDKHLRLIEAFTDYHLYIVKNRMMAGGSETAYKSATKATANALQKFSKFIATNQLNINLDGNILGLESWQEIRSEHLIQFRDWAFKEIKSRGQGKNKFTIKQTVNGILRIIYKFYEWAQEDACLVDRVIGWTDCQIRSALIVKRTGSKDILTKDDLLYPACYVGVGGKSHFGGAKYWATNEDIFKLEEYFWANYTAEVAERNIVILKIVDYMGWRPGSVNSLTLEMFTTNAMESRKRQDVYHITPPKQKFERDYSFEMPFTVLDMICRYINGARARMLKGRSDRHMGMLFVSETTGAPLTDDALTDIFTKPFQAIGAPKDSGLRSIRRKFCEDMFKAEIEFRKSEGLSLAYEDVAFAISQKMGHDSMISQEAYYRVLRRRRQTNSIVEEQKDALATKDAELIIVKARCAQLEARISHLERQLSKIAA